MTPLSQKVLDNRRRQHAQVTAHRRRIRDEVRPALMQTKRNWYESSRNNNHNIKIKWHAQRKGVRMIQRSQRLIHRAKILAHRRRIRSDMANRG